MQTKRLGLKILGVLGLTFAMSSTAFAKGNDGERRDGHGQRDQRDNHGRRDDRADGRWQDDRAERMRAYERQMRAQREKERSDLAAWQRGRAHRAAYHRQQIQSTWTDVCDTPQGRAELATHADRMARLHRAHDVARQMNDAAMTARVANLIGLEVTRDALALSHLRLAIGR